MAAEAEKQKLYNAVENEDVATIKEVLKGSPNIVKEVPFSCSRNLLHVAMMHGEAEVVAEVLNTHPRLARDLDSTNSSPLHIAAAKGSFEIAARLMAMAPETLWWRDCHDMNPVHIAAVNGHVVILSLLLHQSPLPAMERVHRGRTVLHLCVKHGRLEALRFLVGMFGELAYAKDDDGETIWRLAVKCNKLVHRSQNMLSNTPSVKAKEASEIVGILKTFSQRRMLEILPKLTASTMVVVVLIATMAFQAAISPPGGVWQEHTTSHKAGNAVMASTHPKLYKHFVRANTAAFISSLVTIFLITTGQPSRRIHFMFISLFAMWVSLASIAVSYGASLLVVSPDLETQSLLPIIITVVCVPVGILGFIYVYSTIRQSYLSWNRTKQLHLNLATDSEFQHTLSRIFRQYGKTVNPERGIPSSEFISKFTPMSEPGSAEPFHL